MTDLETLFDNLKSLYTNIKKEPQERRVNLARVNKLILDVGDIEQKFHVLKLRAVNEDSLIEAFNSNLINIRAILFDRLKNITETSVSNLDNVSIVNMPEKFDLKTAGTLLPAMDGSESVTKQLLDAIELYSEILDDAGKTFLIKYVLKTKLTENAKLRLKTSYTGVDELTRDIKAKLLTVKSAASLSTQLHFVKQNNRNVDDYAKSVEQLFLELTLAQADGNDAAVPVLRQVNEKLAINAFANGLRDGELRTIIKARDYKELKDAVSGAKDEEKSRVTLNNSSSVFHMRNRQSSFTRSRGHYNPGIRGRASFSTNTRNNSRSTYSNSRSNFNNNYNQRGTQNYRQVRSRGNNVPTRGNSTHNTNCRRSYFAGSDSNRIDECENVVQDSNRFFRE